MLIVYSIYAYRILFGVYFRFHIEYIGVEVFSIRVECLMNELQRKANININNIEKYTQQTPGVWVI